MADIIERLIFDLIHRMSVPSQHCGVIVSLKAQQRLITDRLKKNANLKRFMFGENSLTVSTVDSFQGLEKEVIIYASVRSNPEGNIGFLEDERRFNVASTRAKRLFVFVGNADCLTKKSRTNCFNDMFQQSMQKGIVLVSRDNKFGFLIKRIIRIDPEEQECLYETASMTLDNSSERLSESKIVELSINISTKVTGEWKQKKTESNNIGKSTKTKKQKVGKKEKIVKEVEMKIYEAEITHINKLEYGSNTREQTNNFTQAPFIIDNNNVEEIMRVFRKVAQNEKIKYSNEMIQQLCQNLYSQQGYFDSQTTKQIMPLVLNQTYKSTLLAQVHQQTITTNHSASSSSKPANFRDKVQHSFPKNFKRGD